jgi:uncharacterized protein
MIPAFPQFKTVDISDKEEIESHTHRYPPYSDFNFTSLWAWDTTHKRKTSILNENLIVQFTDYKTDEPFLSFLGVNDTEHTARTLLDYCRKENLPQTLKLIPQIAVDSMRSPLLHIIEDRDNFDYIYSVPDLSALQGSKFKGRRNFVNRFFKDHPYAKVEIIDLANPDAQKSILRVLSAWGTHKESQEKEYELKHEEEALLRLFSTADSHTLTATAIFDKDAMLAFSIDESLPNQYCIGHFWKADTKHPGIFDALMQKKAQHLEEQGLLLLNYEQDLGVAGLRKSKMDYRPVDFLKKYIVSLST